ncbi:leucine-rich repeat domain-containing protein [Brachyspira sp. SAP_772]|uniref:leucine-rich repeat domain-containing protein n=1 Tax=Brachyspira sp. SAP_772 TaxID=2608385 RepID=UPI0012F516AE|nr:leucine-rich repeat domain-containing protein [Brachyspira sp. SAP_772]
MKRIIFIVLIASLLLSCKSQSTSPDNNTSDGGASSGGDNNTETPEPPPFIISEEAKKYGIDINTATSETIKTALNKYYNDKTEYKIIFTNTSTRSYDKYTNLGTIINEIKDINNITVSFENVQFQNNKLPDYILGGDSSANRNITKVILPDYITIIGQKVFFNCYVLAEVNMPKKLQEIGISVFYNTKVKNIDLPDGLKIINDRAFKISIIENIDIPDSVTSIGEAIFDSCKQLQTFKLPKNFNVIPKSAFASCSALKTITIQESITSIEDSAFYACTGAENFVFEGENPKLTTIGDSAFGWCSKLATITIPASVKTIKDLAFYTCPLLTSITFLSETPPSMNGSRIFESTPLKTINVPKGSKDAYEALKGKHSISKDVVINEI